MDNAVIHSVARGAGAGSVPEPLGWDGRAVRHQGGRRHNTARAQAAFTQGNERKVGFFRCWERTERAISTEHACRFLLVRI